MMSRYARHLPHYTPPAQAQAQAPAGQTFSDEHVARSARIEADLAMLDWTDLYAHGLRTSSGAVLHAAQVRQAIIDSTFPTTKETR